MRTNADTITMNQVHKTYIECRRIAHLAFSHSSKSEEDQVILDRQLDALQDMVRGLEEEAYGEARTTFKEEMPVRTKGAAYGGGA